MTKKKIKKIEPIVSIIIITSIISILSFILSIFNVKSSIASIDNGTIEMSLVSVRNIFSSAGISYVLSNTITNFRLVEPIALFVIFLISISALEFSGLINHLAQSIKKINPNLLNFCIILLSSILTLFGEYSYVILIPFVAVLFKYLNRNPVYGMILVFVGIVTGYSTGIIYNYNYYSLGLITENAASISIDDNYSFNLLSNYYIMLACTFIVSIITFSITNKILKKFNTKYEFENNLLTSDKALLLVNIINLLFLLIIAYGIIPGIFSSGFLLDNNQTNYVAMLFSNNAPFKEGFLLIILFSSLICSYVYGKISNNIKGLNDFEKIFSKNADNFGYILILVLFVTILSEIVNWTNIFTCFSGYIINLLSQLQFSGPLLVITFYIAVLIISFLIPDTVTKWNMISPLLIPLFMKANISPEFTQFIFSVADNLGKAISPLFIYLIILIGYINMYNKSEKYNLSDILRKIISILILIAGVWLLIIVTWYVIGLPLGVGTSIIM